jgi:predicted KAP-like P-loop ATPase
MSAASVRTGADELVARDDARPGPAVSADRPLLDPREDRLGYAPFARALAEGICAMSAPDGLVVGIYGAWGLGKTTVLNFVEHYLHESQPGQFDVIRFNPWWFSGRVDIAAAFFDQLRGAFLRWQGDGDQAKRCLERLARVVGAESGLRIGDAPETPGRQSSDVPELKRELARTLGEQERRLLVVIDDIDRLSEGEVAQLFAVVKALADLPNVLYLLAFDRDQVSNALRDRSGQSGFNYLEKIVQVPFELPLPERGSLRTLFLEQLRGIVGEVDSELLDTEALNAVLTTGLEPLMRTPRDIVRLTNSLRVTYGAVRGEVNVVDFVALEALRVFEPKVYDRIRARPDLFGVLSRLARSLPQSSEAAQRAYHVMWCRAIEDAERREAVKQIVASVFPEAAAALEARLGIGRGRSLMRRSRAAAEPDYFPVYFRFALGDQLVSRELIAALVAPTAHPDALNEGLLALATETAGTGRTRASAMLDELIAQAEEGFDPASIPRIIKSLTSIGDRLWVEIDDEPFGVDNQTRIVWLIGGLLERIAPADRCSTLHEALADAESIATPALLVRRLLRSLGVADDASLLTAPSDALDERHALISIDCGMRLEQLVARKIAIAAASDAVWDAPRVRWVLGEWGRWEGDAGALPTWFRHVLANDEQLGRLLRSFATEQPAASGRNYRLDPRWFDEFAPWNEVAEAVLRLEGLPLDDSTMRARDRYLTELAILEQGDDPNERVQGSASRSPGNLGI